MANVQQLAVNVCKVDKLHVLQWYNFLIILLSNRAQSEMYRPERGSGLHCDNGRLQAGTCASVKEGDNGRDHHNCSSSIHNTFYSQASLLPGILLGISRTPGKILHYPALRCSLKKGCVQAPSHPDSTSTDIITSQQ